MTQFNKNNKKLKPFSEDLNKLINMWKISFPVLAARTNILGKIGTLLLYVFHSPN